jgi:predicted Rossmann-fold nucleotide-binding protein
MRRARRIPIILVEGEFWAGLLDWFRNTLAPAGTINAEDLNLMQIQDDPEAIVRAIFQHYETRGFAPSAKEREIMLEL